MDINFSATLEDEDPRGQAAAEAENLSVESVKPTFAIYVGHIDKMEKEATAIAIGDHESLNIGVMMAGEAKKIAKAIEKRRKEIIEPASNFVKSVNGFAKQFTERLDRIESGIKKKITDYQYKVELERRKAEEAARRAAAELQEKLRREAEEANRKALEEARKKAEAEASARKLSDTEASRLKAEAEAEAKANEIAAPVVAPPVIPEQKLTTRTETGVTSYQVKRWVCTVIDADAVPRQYCQPVQKLLDEAVKMGVREIAGCRIEEVTETRLRT